MSPMVSCFRRLKSGQITCYLNRTYHVLPTPDFLDGANIWIARYPYSLPKLKIRHLFSS